MGRIFPPRPGGRDDSIFCTVYIQFVTFEWKSDVIGRTVKFSLLLKCQQSNKFVFVKSDVCGVYATMRNSVPLDLH